MTAPDLVPKAQKGRRFTILFDYETKPKTKQQLFQATHRTASTISFVNIRDFLKNGSNLGYLLKKQIF
ncbi:DUF3854 domain-containing protein [Nostoc sp.]|uniref:DUF3854 domain-containing protein n=1 Tax=Nostoc sp. TaxID=1180 RepID=UPI003FA595EB